MPDRRVSPQTDCTSRVVVYEKFTDMLVEKTKALKVGHGATEGTTMGPVCTPRGLTKAEEQASDAVKHGSEDGAGYRQVA